MAYVNKVITMLGQSNIVGPVPKAQLPAAYSGFVNSVKIFDNSNERYSALNVDLNNNQFDNPANNFGIEPYFKDYFSGTKKELYLLKCTKGATYLANTGAANCWAQGVAGGMFSTFQNVAVSRTNSFMSARGKAVEYSVVIWGQGEADSLNQTYADAYETNLNTFIPQVNTVLGSDPVWLIIQLSANTTDPNLIYKNTIRTAQVNVVAANPAKRILIPTDDITFQADGVHYDFSGNQTVAQRIIYQCRNIIVN